MKPVRKKKSKLGAVVLCPLCSMKYCTSIMPTHFYEKHSIIIEKEDLIFGSTSDFINWKEHIELETKAKFIKSRGVNKLVDGRMTREFICCRSGLYKPGFKRVGSYKMNAYCPAKMKVIYSEDEVNIEFFKTHVGHPMETVSRHEASLARSKSLIPTQISDDAVSNCIMNSYITWVSLVNNTSKVIRFYKAEGEVLEDQPHFTKDDFFLVLANDVQLEVLKTFGNDCVCVDRTQHLNSFGFEIYSLLVVDNLRQGIPVAFFFTNRHDVLSLQLFFDVLRVSLNFLLEPKFFISDFDEIFYNTWSTIRPTKLTKHLYCTWHVDKAWKSMLSEIPDKDIQLNIYNKLKDLMFEKDKEQFYESMDNLLSELHKNETTLYLTDYFEFFKSNAHAWAYWYRLTICKNTNLHLTNINKTLKCIYSKAKGKKLERAVYSLMKYVKEKIINRITYMNEGKLVSKLLNFWDKHKSSLEQINDLTVSKCIGTWKIPSTTRSDEHQVVEVNQSCDCPLRCTVCSVCIHAFICTCYDSVIRWNICKHIHLVSHIEKQINSVNSGTCQSEGENEHSRQVSFPITFEDKKVKLIDQLNLLFSHVTNEKQLTLVNTSIEQLDAQVQFLGGNDGNSSMTEPLVKINQWEP